MDEERKAPAARPTIALSATCDYCYYYYYLYSDMNANAHLTNNTTTQLY